MTTLVRNIPVALFIAGSTLACTASLARDAASTCQSVTNLQKRIVERADQGIESLRTFVWMTNIVHGVPMSEVSDSLDTWRAAIACQKQVAQATEESEVAATVAEAGR
jgi:hypothetical protein